MNRWSNRLNYCKQKKFTFNVWGNAAVQLMRDEDMVTNVSPPLKVFGALAWWQHSRDTAKSAYRTLRDPRIGASLEKQVWFVKPVAFQHFERFEHFEHLRCSAWTDLGPVVTLQVAQSTCDRRRHDASRLSVSRRFAYVCILYVCICLHHVQDLPSLRGNNFFSWPLPLDSCNSAMRLGTWNTCFWVTTVTVGATILKSWRFCWRSRPGWRNCQRSLYATPSMQCPDDRSSIGRRLCCCEDITLLGVIFHEQMQSTGQSGNVLGSRQPFFISAFSII